MFDYFVGKSVDNLRITHPFLLSKQFFRQKLTRNGTGKFW